MALKDNLSLLPDWARSSFGRTDQAITQPINRITTSGFWSYRGGPNMASTYNSDWALLRQYPFAGRISWQFSAPDLPAASSNLPQLKTRGGTVNGLVNPSQAPTIGYGCKTLYGANCVPPQDIYSYVDYGNPRDVDRALNNLDGQLGNAAGTRYWISQGNTVHYDDPTTLAAMWYYAGPFGSDMEASFSVPNYGALLRGLYANDAAYQAAARSGVRANHPPHEQAWRRHLISYVRRHFLEKVRPIHDAAGVEASYNGFAAIPNSWQTLCNLAIGAEFADWLIVELDWRDTEPKASLAAAEDLATPQRLLTMFARVQMACASMRMFGARGVLAPYPLSKWLPPNTLAARWSGMADTTFDDSPPTSSAYTEPASVAAHYRALCLWSAANGVMPAIPVRVFDYLTNYLADAPWQGVNRMQWTANPADVAGVFNFFGMNRDLFDGFELAPTVAIAIPDMDERYSNSSSNATSAAGDCWVGPTQVEIGPDWDLSRMKRYCRDYITPLMIRGIPWCLTLLGEGLDKTRRATDYAFSRFDAVIKGETDATYTQNNADIPAGTNVQAQAWTATGSNLTPIQFVTVTGVTDASRPVLAAPAAHKDGRIRIGLVNTNNVNYSTDALNAAQSAVKVAVRSDVVGKRIRQALWYAPGLSAPVPLRLERGLSTVTVSVPPFTDGGFVVMQ